MKRLVNGVEVELEIDPQVQIGRLSDRLTVRTASGTSTAVAVRRGDTTLVSYRGVVYEIAKVGARRHQGGATQTGEAHAPMPGQIVDVLVAEGDAVEAGDKLLVLEAMKTQQPVLAPFDGTVARLPVAKGEQVSEGQMLILIAPTP